MTVAKLATEAAQRLHSPWQAACGAHEDDRPAAFAGLMAYEHAKRASAAFDFDDLLLHAAVALESDLALRAALGRRWRYVLLDEVQDTNAAQYRIVALLAEHHRNLMILGDPDQAICAYRGATSAENFAAFARDFPEHDVVALERNYRSTATILTAANALIAANRGRLDKRLWTTGPAGDPIAVEDADDELDEAQRIATWARDPPRRRRPAVGTVRPRARQRARRRHRAGAHGRPRPGARRRRARVLVTAPRSATRSPPSPWSPTRATGWPSPGSPRRRAPEWAKRRAGRSSLMPTRIRRWRCSSTASAHRWTRCDPANGRRSASCAPDSWR